MFPIKKTHLSENPQILSLCFAEADELEFPVIWLRDNCQCVSCFDPISNSRIHGPLEYKKDVLAKSVASTTESVSITWADGHRSLFRKDWLCKHSFQPEHQIERLTRDHISQISWNSKSFPNIPSNFDFDEVIKDDNTLLKWLETLATYGIAKIIAAPLECGQLSVLAKRISYIRKTQYGEEFYIKGDVDANNVAYLRGPLQMHTDLPYYNHVPGVVMLHFVEHGSTGGENILADGLNIVKQLPKLMYHTLASTTVDWLDIGYDNGSKFHSMHRAPVICENSLGNIDKINWSQPQRNSVFNVTPDCAINWYEAASEFSRLIHDNSNAVIIKNTKGTILTFDNRRILHGRTDYTGKRFLCGAYIDWDEIYSRIRVLRQDLKVS
ncbi:hypothetical protein RUM44_011427 [Polyplax serrata]|uniref:Gamma-butyrobetaine dioxygenase n=1 Tax=Polyplax serrata TaxID=468196 RepID=A0ABR1ARU7_POLSC